MFIFDNSKHKKASKEIFDRYFEPGPVCPNCHSNSTHKHRIIVSDIKENPTIKYSNMKHKQLYLCRSCRCYFVDSLEENEFLFDGTKFRKELWWYPNK